MNKRQRVWAFLKSPPYRFLIVIYLLTVMAVSASVLALTLPNFPLLLGYTVYAVSALLLAYTVFTLVHCAPRIKRDVLLRIERHKFTRDLKESFGFRTLIFSAVSFGINIAYGVFNGVLGILSLSVWYGALAAYYILLSLLRGSILWHRTKNGKSDTTQVAAQLRCIKVYRTCGILLLLLQTALSAAIAQMILDDRAFRYDMEWMVFAVAAYTFYKIIMAIINFLKGQGQSDLTVEAVRNINLADATVSILALQTTLLGVYRTEGLSVSGFNAATGSAVSLFILGLGIFMIIKAQGQINKCKTEQANGK